MAELKSKAPLPFTVYLIESEVFSVRTKEHGTDHLLASVRKLAGEIAKAQDKKARDTLAVRLAAECVRIIEEIK